MQADIMRTAGFQDDEIARLTLLKQRVDAGQQGELTFEYKRLLFFRFLYASGQLHDGRVGGPQRQLSTSNPSRRAPSSTMSDGSSR